MTGGEWKMHIMKIIISVHHKVFRVFVVPVNVFNNFSVCFARCFFFFFIFRLLYVFASLPRCFDLFLFGLLRIWLQELCFHTMYCYRMLVLSIVCSVSFHRDKPAFSSACSNTLRNANHCASHRTTIVPIYNIGIRKHYYFVPVNWEKVGMSNTKSICDASHSSMCECAFARFDYACAHIQQASKWLNFFNANNHKFSQNEWQFPGLSLYHLTLQLYAIHWAALWLAQTLYRNGSAFSMYLSLFAHSLLPIANPGPILVYNSVSMQIEKLE